MDIWERETISCPETNAPMDAQSTAMQSNADLDDLDWPEVYQDMQRNWTR